MNDFDYEVESHAYDTVLRYDRYLTIKLLSSDAALDGEIFRISYSVAGDDFEYEYSTHNATTVEKLADLLGMYVYDLLDELERCFD